MVIGPMIVAMTLQLDNGLGPLGDFGVIMQLLCLIPALLILLGKTRSGSLSSV
ncbi:hypothetical protein D9M69_625250 [compost metagenome]